MKLTLFGAANEVTGSCNLIEGPGTRILIDCGMFQGSGKSDARNRIPARLDARTIDAVLLTHGHLDHCGRLPLLLKSGFKGPIYATEGSVEIAKIILADAVGIQQADISRENRKRARAGLSNLKPLFNEKDVRRVIDSFRPVLYNRPVKLNDFVTANFVEAGHILGSSCIELTTTFGGRQLKTVFSGDLGQFDIPIMLNPERIDSADVVVMESTYGDRDHRCLQDTLIELKNIVVDAIQNSSKVLIPSFAIGRSQVILYHLAELFRIGALPPIPIYLDSPMASAASRTYINYANALRPEVSELIDSGQLRKDLATLVICETGEQSQALNAVSGPCIIIAGAGMCNAGRILHHLKHNLWKEECHVVIVGYQAKTSLGRELLDGAPTVKIAGDTICVKAKVSALGGLSAHAGQSDLLRWLEPMTHCMPRVILNHGESHSSRMLSQQIETRFGIEAEIPRLADTLVLQKEKRCYTFPVSAAASGE
ncbi:MAG: MBL fold metallo-hydrolase [Candidatus Obscuribacterales bacterium]|nr:MBL fold metallo-hydrolase [Candidatus Obscuribacterales bacterium]